MSQNEWPKIENLRREYGDLALSQDNASPNPFIQFKLWFEEVLQYEKADPTAMVLSTVDKNGQPDARVVLLKGLENDSFVFYTNYQSAKAIQLADNAHCALNFYWPEMARQVRIRGKIEKTSKAQSDAYFSTRPITSQIAAKVSLQSHSIANRSILDKKFEDCLAANSEKPIPRPENWGGYRVIPHEIEFWQGRNNRLHDRLLYSKGPNAWKIARLAP